ncbi:DNA polymerase II [Aliivibrio kagoshimensis]|uniref:DNA polymerase II n=1 Tax=Aliivibrio kagoshimensis TaxID=2910230 RepID=UPI003D119F0F
MVVQQGFLLTRHSRDMSTGTELSLWLSTDSGPVQLTIPAEQPVCFVPVNSVEQVNTLLAKHQISHQIKPLKLSTFDQQPVSGCYFQTTRAMQLAVAVFNEHGVEHFEADIRLADRYLMERFICGGIDFVGEPRSRLGYTQYHHVKAKAGSYQPQLSVVSLDIECSEKGILYSVGLHSEKDSRVIMIGDPQDEAETTIEWVADEKALLIALEKWFQTYDPDLVIGWSVVDFDFRLLIKRAEWHKLPFRIGRGNSKAYFRASTGNRRQGFLSLPGRVVLDGIGGLKMATYNFSSWSLESVSQQLLNQGKSIHNAYDRMDEINRMFRHDKLALAKYNLQDCVLVSKIFEKTNLIAFLIERTKLTGIELDKMGGSVAAFTNLYLPKLHRAGYVAPNLKSDDWIASPGGFVMESKPGLYDSVLVLDFKSLYPSIIRSFKIDPLGLIEGLPLEESKDGAIAGFRGGRFHREKHFLPEMIEHLWAARDVAKKEGNAAFSQAIKIIMNSFYGVLGSSGCRFFDHRLASSITMRGHQVLNQTREMIEQHGFEVIYGDTDSVFVSLGSQKTEAQADEIGAMLVESINQQWTATLRETFDLDNHLELEYETHYMKFLMPTIRGSELGSKKRYAGLVLKEGEQTMIYKGLESVRTDWTPLSQQFQQELYHRVFHQQEVVDFVRDYHQRTLSGEFDSRLIYRKRLRRQLDEYQKNVPPHVRAARIADEHNKKLGRPLQYQQGGWIEYLITLRGPEPLEMVTSTIDYEHYVEKQLMPVADGILPFIGLNFDELTKPQMGLF